MANAGTEGAGGVPVDEFNSPYLVQSGRPNSQSDTFTQVCRPTIMLPAPFGFGIGMVSMTRTSRS